MTAFGIFLISNSSDLPKAIGALNGWKKTILKSVKKF